MGIHSVGTVAIVVVLSGTMFWSVLLLSSWIIWPCIVVMLINWSEGWRPLALIASGQFEAQAVGLLAIGIAIILLAGVRLCRLNEDMPEYHRRMPTGWAAKGRMTGQNLNYDGPLPRRLMDWFREQALADVTRHVQCAARSPWSRICRWQVGMPTGWRVWLWGLFPIVLQLFLTWRLPHRTPTAASFMMVANSLTMLPTILAASQSVGWLMWRTRMSGYELMLPMDRRAYVRQAGAAMALGYFQTLGRDLRHHRGLVACGRSNTASVGYLGSVATVALFTQIGLFGVMVFVWTITSVRAVQMAAFMVCVLASTILVMGGCRDLNAQLRPETMPAAAGSAVLGAVGLHCLSPLAGGGFRRLRVTRNRPIRRCTTLDDR